MGQWALAANPGYYSYILMDGRGRVNSISAGLHDKRMNIQIAQRM